MNNVLIAVPALTLNVNLSLATFLVHIVGRRVGSWTFHLVVAPELSPVHFARNTLAGEFLSQTDMSHLWFIDHDMLPDASTLRLLEIDADIVCGRCLATRPGPQGVELRVTAYTHRDPESGVFTPVPPTLTDPVPIVGAGAANMLIRRAVLEDRRMRLSPDYVDSVGTPRSLCDEAEAAPAIFRTLYKPNGDTILSEDLDFVYRAFQLGYRCMYQPAARLGHLKLQDLNSIESMLQRGPLPDGRRDG